MKKLILTMTFLMITAGAALAQTPQPPKKEYLAQGYGYIGPAVFSTGSDALIHYGGGAEGFLKGGLAANIEAGGFSSSNDFSDGFAVLSPGASYHVRKATPSGKVVPFVTGGYTLFASSGGVTNGVHFGGGVTYWFKERIGLRVDVRDHVAVADNLHIIGFRVGISFR
ncbi:MAG: hypothetical protein SF339_25900 [Blastocatellia bacterium]|nr:hypothetical protein [Blastocatellia bacterium]